MNLVKLITDQISSDTIGKLSALLGINGETAQSAVGAAIPSLLAGLGGLVSQDDGVRKLTGVLNSLDDSTFGSLDRQLHGDASAMLQKGNSLLGSLFGDGSANNLSSAISRYAGLSSDTARSLLSYLMPLVLGRVASQWQNLGATPGALRNLFAEQQPNIANAVPADFDLDGVPGLARFREMARPATSTARSQASESRSLAATLLPLALLLLAAFAVWSFWNNRPANQAAVDEEIDETEEVVVMKPVAPELAGLAGMPEATRAKEELTEFFTSATSGFAKIKDAASAEAALPQLEELNRKIDTLRTALSGLPEAGRTALDSFLKEHVEPLKRQATSALSLPNLSERVKSLIQEIVRKLEELHIIDRTP
jgi:hypothetical protein